MVANLFQTRLVVSNLHSSAHEYPLVHSFTIMFNIAVFYGGVEDAIGRLHLQIRVITGSQKIDGMG